MVVTPDELHQHWVGDGGTQLAAPLGDDDERRGWLVLGDRYRLGQVLSNFLSNAVKFSPIGSLIRVAVRLAPAGIRHDDISSGWLECQVVDAGIGISADGLHTLFRPYQQIHAGALQEGRGSGLGLSIAKRLVELHGGRVHVRSRLGEGSVFAFVVPVQIVDLLDASPLVTRTVQVNIDEKTREQEVAGVADELYTQPPPPEQERLGPQPESSIHAQPALPVPSGPPQLVEDDEALYALVVEDSAINRKLLC